MAACLWAGMGVYLSINRKNRREQAIMEQELFATMQGNMLTSMQLQRRLIADMYSSVPTPEVKTQTWIQATAEAVFASQTESFARPTGIVLYKTVTDNEAEIEGWVRGRSQDNLGVNSSTIRRTEESEDVMHLVTAAWPETLVPLVGMDVVPLRGRFTKQLVQNHWAVTDVTELTVVRGMQAFLYYTALPQFGRHPSGMPLYFLSVSGGFAVAEQEGYSILLCTDGTCAGPSPPTKIKACSSPPAPIRSTDVVLPGFLPDIKWVLRITMCVSLYNRIMEHNTRQIVLYTSSFLGVLVWATVAVLWFVFEQRIHFKTETIRWRATQDALYNMLSIMFHRLGTPLDALMAACAEQQDVEEEGGSNGYTHPEYTLQEQLQWARRRRPLSMLGVQMTPYLTRSGGPPSGDGGYSLETTSSISDAMWLHLLLMGTLQLHEVHSMLGAVNSGINASAADTCTAWDVSWLAFTLISKHSLTLPRGQKLLSLCVQSEKKAVCVKHRAVQFVVDQGLQNALAHGGGDVVKMHVYVMQQKLWIDIWNFPGMHIPEEINVGEFPALSPPAEVKADMFTWGKTERSEEGSISSSYSAGSYTSQSMGFGLSACKSLAVSGACSLYVGYQPKQSGVLFRACFNTRPVPPGRVPLEPRFIPITKLGVIGSGRITGAAEAGEADFDTRNWTEWGRTAWNQQGAVTAPSFEKLWIRDKTCRVVFMHHRPRIAIPLGLLQGQCIMVLNNLPLYRSDVFFHARPHEARSEGGCLCPVPYADVSLPSGGSFEPGVPRESHEV